MTSSSTTQYDPRYREYFHNVLDRSEDVYGKMKGKTAADAIESFTPDQLAAQGAVRGNQGTYRPYFDKASGIYDAAGTAAGDIATAGAGAFGQAAANPGGSAAAQPYFDQASGRFTDPGVAQSYMSPYLDAVAGNTIRLSNQNLMENVLPGVHDTFSGGTMGAQFGRERHADIAGRAIRDQQNTLTGNLANIYSTGFGNAQGQYSADQARLGGLGTSAGALANSTIGAFGGLGSQQTAAATQGVVGQLSAGQAQAGLGLGTQGAGYTDAGALAASGAEQQALGQQGRTFNLQYPWQLLQTQQGLGQGWQVDSTTTGQSKSTQTKQAASGSPFGQILGAGLGIASLGIPGGGSLGGSLLSKMFSRGGRVGHFATGGYAPLVNDARQTMQRRLPAMQQRLQARQQPQGGAPAFACGGAVRRAAGGYTDANDDIMSDEQFYSDPRTMAMRARGFYSPFLDAEVGPFGRSGTDPRMPQPFTDEERTLLEERERPRGFFERAGDFGRGALEGVRELASDVPAAFGREVRRYRDDPLGHAAKVLYPWTPQGVYSDMVKSGRAMIDPDSDWLERTLGGAGMALNLLGVNPAARWAGRAATRFGTR